MPKAGDTIYASRTPGLLVAYLQRNVTAQSFANFTETAIAFDVAVLDRQGGWVSSPNPSRFTPTLAGWYAMSGMIGYELNSSGLRRARWLFNGASIDGGFQQQAASTTTTPVIPPAIPILFNGTTDFVELAGFHTSSTSPLSTTLGNLCPWMKLIYVGSS